MTYKNIRIKKKGGGFRTQRVRVLASGKYRFVKNPARARTKSRSRTVTRRKKSNPKRSVRRTARRRKKRRSRGGFTIPLAPIAGLAAGMATPIQKALDGDWVGALDKLAYNYAGVEGVEGGNPRFNPNGLQNGLVPLIIGAMVHKFVGGRPLNLNAMLARAKVPFIRI